MRLINYIPYFLISLLIIASCSRAFEPDVRTGSGQMHTEGTPEIRLSALGYFNEEGDPVIDLEADVVIGSLIFSSEDDKHTAAAGIQVEAYKLKDEDDERGERVKSFEDGFKISDPDESVRTTNETRTVRQQMEVDPGKYRVVLTVTDQDSRKASQTESNVIVNDPKGEEPVLTHVKVAGKGGIEEPSFPVTTYSIPSRLDSLSFSYKVSRSEEHEPVELRMRLIRFESDDSPPRRMSQPQPTRGSIEFKGIDYSEKEIIEEQSRTLFEETGSIEIEYKTPLPDRGAYRFEVSMKPEGGSSDDRKNLKARDFGIVSPNFPNIKSVREMAQAMVYIMNRSDHEEMMEINNEDSLKAEMDRFWLENLGSKEEASRVIEKYFNRVEEANRQFTNFKEGWKTDMGMMYVLFGPPYYVDRRVNYITWIYGYNRNDPNRVFNFERARMDSDQYPFTHYVFMRDRDYHQVEYRQRQRWLSGTILSRPI